MSNFKSTIPRSGFQPTYPEPGMLDSNNPNSPYSSLFSQNTYQDAFNPLRQDGSGLFNGVRPKDGFRNNNFLNDGRLLHNNLYPDILKEEIVEHTVMIDSKDRNYEVYPNPFCYDVIFNPIPTTRRGANGNNVIYEDPTPTINIGFENVRYIKLETAILPYYNRICRKRRVLEELDERGLEQCVTDTSIDVYNPLTENLYTVLVIEEYQDVNYRSTNDVLSDSFCTLYYDHKINDSHFRTCTQHAAKVFPPDQLGRINKFRIRFLDPYGCQLNVKHLDPCIKSGMTCCCDEEGDDCCFKHNLYHPLNPLWQNHLQFKVGVVEPYLNKRILS